MGSALAVSILVLLVSGGARAGDPSAFSMQLEDVPPSVQAIAGRGRALFREVRLSGSRSDGRGGLGPVFNRNACSGCHVRNGRGRAPVAGEAMRSMVIRFGGEPVDPVYGRQLNDKAILGVGSEGKARMDPGEVLPVSVGGTTVVLRRPDVALQGLAFGPLNEEASVSPRVAPHVAGVGLLEVIPDQLLLQRADPSDEDGDGISGRARRVVTPSGVERVGRFGWRARHARVRDLVTEALLEDMGVTTPDRPRPNCTPRQEACTAHARATGIEIEDDDVEALVVYLQTLAPPRPRERPGRVEGSEIFREIGCAACHVPEWVVPTATGSVRMAPYTDLLLHDMGEGLADRRLDGAPAEREWRTAPLWGVSRVQEVNGHRRFLHDGRAEGLVEAVLWHGGEAWRSREAFRRLSSSERDAVLAFLESL